MIYLQTLALVDVCEGCGYIRQLEEIRDDVGDRRLGTYCHPCALKKLEEVTA